MLPCLLIMTRTRAVKVRLEPNCLFSLAIVHKHITLAPFCSWTNKVYKCSYSANVWYHCMNMLNTILSVTKKLGSPGRHMECCFVKKKTVSCCIPSQVLLLAVCLAASCFLTGVRRSVIYTEMFDVIVRPLLAAKVWLIIRKVSWECHRAECVDLSVPFGPNPGTADGTILKSFGFISHASIW